MSVPQHRGFTELIGRALIDPDFRRLLYQDRDSATAGYSLSPGDRAALDAIPQSAIDEHSLSRDAKEPVAVRIMIGVAGHFN